MRRNKQTIAHDITVRCYVYPSPDQNSGIVDFLHSKGRFVDESTHGIITEDGFSIPALEVDPGSFKLLMRNPDLKDCSFYRTRGVDGTVVKVR